MVNENSNHMSDGKSIKESNPNWRGAMRQKSAILEEQKEELKEELGNISAM